MTLDEMRTEVQAILGGRSDATDDIVDDYINAAYKQLAMSFRFYELENTSTSTTTVSGTASYAVPTGCRQTISIVDTTNKNKLEPRDIAWYEQQDTSTDVTGAPEYYVRYGSNYLLWPTPDGAYSLRIRYTALPDTITTGEEPVYSVEWHRVLVFLAASSLCFRFGLDSKGMNLKNEALGMISALQEDQVQDARMRTSQVSFERTRPSGRLRGYAENP